MLSPFHILSQQRFRSTTRFIASRESLTNDSPVPFTELLSQIDLSFFFSTLPELFPNLAQSVTFLKGLRSLNSIIKHPDFSDLSFFENPDFVSHWPHVLSLLIPTITEYAIQAIEIVAQLWKVLSNPESPIASSPFVSELIRSLSNPLASLKPSVFFALANYSAISKTARDRLIALDIESHLVRYLVAFTCNDHVKSGLRLAANILGYGVEDVLEFAQSLIPIFRCHLLHSSEKNRRLAAHCLTLLLDTEILFQKCIEFEVPTQLCRCVEMNRVYFVYSNEMFMAVSLFVTHGYFETFMSGDFLNVLGEIVGKNLEVPMQALFGLLNRLMEIIGDEFGRFLEVLECQAEKGCFENRCAAIFLIFRWLEKCDSDAVKKLATDQLFHSVVDILQAGDEMTVEVIIVGILKILELRDEEVNAIWKSGELTMALQEINDDRILELFPQLIGLIDT
jgi:hypothetical protein